MAKLTAYPGGKSLPGKVDMTGGGDNSGGMEARVARLESDVSHIQKDVAEMKTDIREMRKEIHSAKIWALILFGSGYASLIAVMAKGFGWLK
jgi:hypothetical protein